MILTDAMLLSDRKRQMVVVRRWGKRVAVNYNSRWGLIGAITMSQTDGDPLTEEDVRAEDWEEVDIANG